MYYYWAYGLNIYSEIPFPELFEVRAFPEPDAILVCGEVPTLIQGEIGFRSEQIMISPTEYLLHINDVASYYVENGKRIVIERKGLVDWESVRLFCLSNAFAALLQQRNLIPLHCSAFLDNDELVLIMGDSGAGKSTTLAALLHRGYLPFSDDVCVPLLKEEGNNELYMCSSYPMMKYWGDTFEKVDIKGGQKDRKIRPDMDKFGVYFHERFITDFKKVKLVVMIEKTSNVYLSTKRLAGIDLFQRLERNAYRGEYLGFTGLKKEHFKLFTSIATTTKTILISRPDSVNSIDGVIDAILGELQ